MLELLIRITILLTFFAFLAVLIIALGFIWLRRLYIFQNHGVKNENEG